MKHVPGNSRYATDRYMRTPLVSVIIPNYNTAGYLVEAIQSVLESTFDAFEVIVVDDGGEEFAAPAVEERFAGNQKIVLIRQENKGLAGARNTGIRAASGKYLVFLDSDDIVLPEKIATQYRFLEDHPEVDVVYSLSDWFLHDDVNLRKKANFPVFEGNVFSNLLYGNFIHVNAAMVRKEKVERAGFFNEVYRELEDWDLWLRMAINGSRFSCIHTVLSLVRLRKGSMTSNQLKMDRAMVKVLQQLLPLLKQDHRFYEQVKVGYFHALHLFKVNAGYKKGFLVSLFDAVKECGLPFLPKAFKLALKSAYSVFRKPSNPNTKELEAYWANK